MGPEKIIRRLLAISRKRVHVAGRFACLGRDVLKLKLGASRRMHLCNIQKGRVDLLMKWLSEQDCPTADVVKPFIPRADVYGLVMEQESCSWLGMDQPPDIILLDSFAELTDQKFSHRLNLWSFCCHYSDVEHTEEFKKLFECQGLLPLDELPPLYEQWFDWIHVQWPAAPIVYLHFPSVLDSRSIYVERAAAIRLIVKNIALSRPYLLSCDVPKEDVRAHLDDDFPYHFSAHTYSAFRSRWNELEKR